MMFVFYGFGMAMYGQISIQMLLFIVSAIYILLIIFANLMAAYNIQALEQTFQTNKKMKRE